MSHSDSVLRRYVDRQAAGEARSSVLPSDAAESGEDTADSRAAFGCVRGGPKERAVMLELRLKNGNIRAVSYSYLERVDFDPSEGIALHINGRITRIRGQNLNAGTSLDRRLYSSICRHRVLWIQECGRGDAPRPDNAEALVEAIELREQ